MYSLSELFRNSTHDDSAFSPETIRAIESMIYTKEQRGKIIPFIKCLIREKEIRLTPEEAVRQLYVHKLIHEYGYDPALIKLEYGIAFGRETKRTDIVIFEKDHPASAYIIVEVKKPNSREGKAQLKSYCNASGAIIGVWTNGEDTECYHRKEPNHFEDLRRLPNAREKLRDVLNTRITISVLEERNKLRYSRKSLKDIILAMEDEVLANAGVDVFEEVFKLIFTKLYDEKQSGKNPKRFLEFGNYGDTDEELKANIQALFDKAKTEWQGVFADDDKITLSPSHLSICVSSLEEVKLFNSNLDVIDDAFEYLMTKSQKGEKGQFFTPRYVIDMCVRMLNPQENESMIDTAAGSCGFPVHTIFYVWRNIRRRLGLPDTDMFTADEIPEECREYVKNNVFAIDFDEKTVRVARTLNLIAGDGQTNVMHLNTLDFGNWSESTKAEDWIDKYNDGWKGLRRHRKTKDSNRDFMFDVVMANPPFAGDIKEGKIISLYELALDSKGKYSSKIGRDILFIERNIHFLKPGGRMAIILPQGRFNNSSDKYIRDYISGHCRILAVIGLHENVFKPHTGTKTSVLLVQKWDDKLCSRRDDYPVFFATMRKPGKDNSGEKIYVRDSDGNILRDSHFHPIVSHDLYNHEGLTEDGIAEAFIEFAKREGLSFFGDARFSEERYRELVSGLKVSEVMLSEILSVCRMDAEYYSKYNRYLHEKLDSIGSKTISDYGGYLDCSAFYPSVAEYYSSNRDDIPFLRVNEINGGMITITNATVFLPEEIIAENRKTISVAYPGDIVIAKGGTVAKVGLVTDDFPRYATSRDVIILRTDKLDGLNKYYLWAFLHSSYGRGILMRSASQTIQPHLTLPSILAIKIPDIITLQPEIEKLYKASAAMKRDSESLYARAQSILNDAIHFIPRNPDANTSVVSFSQVFSTGRMDAEYFMPKYDELLAHLETLPAKRLGEIVTITKSIEPGSEFYSTEGVPFIRVSDITEAGITPPAIRIPRAAENEKLYPKKDTILLSKDGTIGIAYKIDSDMEAVTSGALLHLRVTDSEVLPDYLALVLNSEAVRLQAERDSNGAIIKHWKPGDIARTVIPIFNSQTQLSISELVRESFALRKESERLISLAVKSVELAVESDEHSAIKLIQEESLS